jgi:hypothetical protein
MGRILGREKWKLSGRECADRARVSRQHHHCSDLVLSEPLGFCREIISGRAAGSSGKKMGRPN